MSKVTDYKGGIKMSIDILQGRDLIQDNLGNYYEVIGFKGSNKIQIVNAIVHYSFRRIANNHFLEEVDKRYNENVGVGQYFADMLKRRIELLSSGEVPGNIYKLSDVSQKYEVENVPLYERNVNIG